MWRGGVIDVDLAIPVIWCHHYIATSGSWSTGSENAEGWITGLATNELYGEYISLLDEVDNINSNLDYYLDME